MPHNGIHALCCMHAGAVWCNNPACNNPGAFVNVAMTVAQYGSYVEGVRANLMAGGDNCSRSCLIGALLAAQVRAVHAYSHLIGIWRPHAAAWGC
jgi:hypothetical protein